MSDGFRPYGMSGDMPERQEVYIRRNAKKHIFEAGCRKILAN
jgi:hypothetical protein